MRRARVLGQYFTPEPVVELCYRLLRILDPDTQNPRIVDPACGEGAFLSYALEHGITSPDRLFGVEKDAEVAAAWEHNNLAGRANVLLGDGLCMSVHPLSPSPPLPVAFDWVVGNPPFGTRCLEAEPNSEELVRMLQEDFTIWQRPGRESVNASRYPIEILFLERFWQLAKPGGHVAVVIPDGILANARLSYVREWLCRRVAVRAVISLPQHIFQRTGASSKASVLVFSRQPFDELRTGPSAVSSQRRAQRTTNHAPVFMAALESREPVRDGIERLAQLFAEFVAAEQDSPLPLRVGARGRGPNAGARDHPSPQPSPFHACGGIPSEGGTRGEGAGAQVFGVLCAPWTVFSAGHVPPAERLDPAYHHPKYVENLRFLRSLPNVVAFGELIEYTTYGQVGSREFTESGVRLLTPANLVTTKEGYVIRVDVYSPERFVSPGSRNDPARSRLQKGDLLLSNSGVGCIGRPAVFYSDEPCNISQHINLIRVSGIEPEYLAVYLQTKFARLQIAREKCGVGPSGINFDRIRSVLVPVLPSDLRRGIVERYRQLSTEPGMLCPLVERLEKVITREHQP